MDVLDNILIGILFVSLLMLSTAAALRVLSVIGGIFLFTYRRLKNGRNKV